MDDFITKKYKVLEAIVKYKDLPIGEKVYKIFETAFSNQMDIKTLKAVLYSIFKDVLASGNMKAAKNIRLLESALNTYINLLRVGREMIYKETIAESEKWWEYEPESDYPKGFFKEWSPKKMADYAIKEHDGDYTAAIRSLIFYKNRAGKNYNSKIRSKIDKAVQIIRKKKEKAEKKDRKKNKK